MLLSRYIECSLTNLPSDIIRKIIEPGNEDFDNMRMVSFICEYKLQKKTNSNLLRFRSDGIRSHWNSLKNAVNFPL